MVLNMNESDIAKECIFMCLFVVSLDSSILVLSLNDVTCKDGILQQFVSFFMSGRHISVI